MGAGGPAGWVEAHYPAPGVGRKPFTTVL